MPNWVTTKLTVTGPAEDLGLFRLTHIIHHPAAMEKNWKNEDELRAAFTEFDFTTVIAMPAMLKGIPSSSTMEDAVEVITGKTVYELTGKGFTCRRTAEQQAQHLERIAKLTPEHLEVGQQAIKAIAETGYATWYEWNIDHWGTKWPSSEFEELVSETERYVFRFQTAWSVPEPVLQTLVERYPTLQFASVSFDECWNFACRGRSDEGSFLLQDEPTSDDVYEEVYGERPDRDPEDETEDDQSLEKEA